MPAVVALAGTPDWGDQVAAILERGGYTLFHCTDPDTYLDQLTAAYLAVLLINGDDPAWPFWLLRPKTDQATRRIPALVIARSPDMEAAARTAGADGFLTVSDLPSRLPDWLREHSRVIDSTSYDDLLCQCAEDLPLLARQGIEKFNAGEYYEQHEILETLWRQESRPVRHLYQGILQVGVAYYHILRGNHTGALRMLRRAVQWFAVLPDICQGVDVRQLREDSARVREALEAMNPADIAQFDRTLLKPVPFKK